ncbi:MAG: hypothetical protein E3J90_13290 [Promethearchaeota archaeon]|nr:MAG: hypothetical protein E3J90_13290 [Candidatus Lokiarchaeota archaeon]
MVMNKRKIYYIRQLSILFVILIVIGNISSFQSNIIVLDDINQEPFNKPTEDILDKHLSDLPDDVGGYSVEGASSFTTIQNASSIISNQDYFANETNYFNITTPVAWNTTSKQFNIESYTKEQIITDPFFMEEFVNGTKYWDNEVRSTGKGTFVQSPLNLNPFGRTRIWNNKLEVEPAYNIGDYAYWTQEFGKLNPESLDIQKGRIYQEEDEKIENYNNFQTNPGFFKDTKTPYGGVYKPLFDTINLYYDESQTSLKVFIDPGISSLGGNPSAAWWWFGFIPYAADYAQITISWNIESASTFEAEDEYEIRARINNKYINGVDYISKSGDVPFNGSKDALMVYNNTHIAGHISHSTISRTYNITDLVDGLVGINKIDFGAWAKNPSQRGDDDTIIVNFESIEIMFNTSRKYEIARLNYRYKLIDNNKLGLNPFTFKNDLSIALYLEDTESSNSEWIRALPFSLAEISSEDFGDTSWVYMSLPISQDYEDIIKAKKLNFKIGVYFEGEFYDKIDYDHYIDNVFFTINYKQAVEDVNLQIKADSSWKNVTSDTYTINTSNWGDSGDSHAFQFRTTNSTYQNKLFLNLKSSLDVTYTSNLSNLAQASYAIEGGNAEKGVWNVTYDNTYSYSKLLEAHFTNLFNLSHYSISYINLPAFDSKGSNSENWNVFSALTPNLYNYTRNLYRFNYTGSNTNQSVTIDKAFAAGNWIIQAYQTNYITNCSFNNTLSYLGDPAFYKDDTLRFNFTLPEKINGNYSYELYNSTGDLMNGYPQFNSSNSKNSIGLLNLAEKYSVGSYYLRFKWNDSASFTGSALRYGSIILSFYIFNKTKAQFTHLVSEVSSGETAEFALNYTTYLDWGIEDATIIVYENSTGTLKFWGVDWTGSYQVGDITHLGNGNYSIPLITEGTPNGTYPLFFLCLKSLHEAQVLTSSLRVIATKSIDFNITMGAYNITSKWVISSDNIPFVNDTLNSVIRVNLTDSGTPLTGGLVIGTIEGSENYFTAQEVGGGLYDLTLNTTNIDPSEKSGNSYLDNETLEIRCTSSGYNIKIVNVTFFVDKIPTQISLQNPGDTFAESSITAVASMLNNIDPNNPKPNAYGNLKYYIVQEATVILNGSLTHLLSGVYQKEFSLAGLSPGEYSLYINGTAINCLNSQSNIVNFTILSQTSTDLAISVPSSIRILQSFQIRTILSYAINGTTIPDQIVKLNISINDEEGFIVSTVTDSEGVSIYEYIISAQYETQNFTVVSNYEGLVEIAGSSTNITKVIQGKIPIFLQIFDFPNGLRVGYSAKYQLRINITEGGETLQNRIILFSAYYNDEFSAPFVTDQLYTDANGQCEFTITEISDGSNNVTVFFEYLGSTTVSYNLTSRLDAIQPKWNSNFTVEPLPSTIRFGQSLSFNMQFYCENNSISLENLPTVLTFNYAGINEIYIRWVNVNNSLNYMYRVANSFSGNLDCSLVFEETSKIAGYSLNFSLSINPKIIVNLEFVNPLQSQYLYGSESFEVRVTDELGTLLDGLLINFQVIDQNSNTIYNYTSTCVNGIAVAILDLSVGDTYIIQVQYFAESYYEGDLLISSEIRVVNEWVMFLDMLPTILIATGIILALGFIVHRGIIVPKRRRRIVSLKALYQKLSDVENMQYVLILTKDGGIPCYSKSLADVPIDESLISGFLSAISTFGKEIGAKIQEGEGGLEELSYRQFKIIINEGKYVNTALLLLKHPSDAIKEKLKNFNSIFEDIYRDRLVNFTGQVLEDTPITKMIEEVFEADLLYPHQVVESKVRDYLKSSTPTKIDKKVMILIRGEEFESNFYLRDLINHLKTRGIDELKSFETIQKLKLDKIVFAINPRTNYLIVEFQKYIKHMDADDKSVLYAIFDGQNDWMKISKYLNKRNIDITKNIDQILEKLKKLHLIDDLNQISETGSAIATILKLIPDL